MGAYGASSPKGSVFWSSRPGVRKLQRILPKKEWSADMVVKTKKDGGGYAVTGSKDLKGSQAYTPEFAMSIMSIWLQEREPKTPDLENVQLPNFYKPHTDRWEDAKLSEVFQYLSLN